LYTSYDSPDSYTWHYPYTDNTNTNPNNNNPNPNTNTNTNTNAISDNKMPSRGKDNRIVLLQTREQSADMS
jgi:hypothetical protein